MFKFLGKFRCRLASRLKQFKIFVFTWLVRVRFGETITSRSWINPLIGYMPLSINRNGSSQITPIFLRSNSFVFSKLNECLFSLLHITKDNKTFWRSIREQLKTSWLSVKKMRITSRVIRVAVKKCKKKQ